jgi:hypothetical protein
MLPHRQMRDRDSLFRPDQHNQLLAARDAGVEQIPLQHGVVLRHDCQSKREARYSEVGRIERSRILDEFVAVTGYHRKHAMRVLRGGCTGARHGLRPGPRVYDEAVREALTGRSGPGPVEPGLSANDERHQQTHAEQSGCDEGLLHAGNMLPQSSLRRRALALDFRRPSRRGTRPGGCRRRGGQAIH